MWQLLACQNEFYPQRTDVECYSVKPPHCLQSMNLQVPNMEDVEWKTTNAQSNGHVELENNSNMLTLGDDSCLLLEITCWRSIGFTLKPIIFYVNGIWW